MDPLIGLVCAGTLAYAATLYLVLTRR